MKAKVLYYVTLISLVSACDGSSFTGRSTGGKKEGAAGGDQRGTGNNGSAGGDQQGIGRYQNVNEIDEGVESKVRDYENSLRTTTVSDDEDALKGGACPLFDDNVPAEQKTRKLQLATGGETPLALNLGDIAKRCRVSGENCDFEFAVYIKCSAFPCSDDKVQEFLLTVPEEAKTGYIAEIYSARVSNYASASCDAIGLANPQQTKRSLDGCFDPETKITTARGEIRIADVKLGEMVLNPLTKTYSPVAEVTVGPESKPMIKIGYGGRSVTVTSEHPFATKSGLKQADELTKADSLLDQAGAFQMITELQRLPVKANQMVYNIRTLHDKKSSESMLILADGIVTGDLDMQRGLARARSAELKFNQPLALDLSHSH